MGKEDYQSSGKIVKGGSGKGGTIFVRLETGGLGEAAPTIN